MPKYYPYIGIVGSVSPYFLIVASIMLSPWFNWFNNALSDLGNTNTNAPVAWIFNAGLMIGGVFSALFAILLSKDKFSWKYLLWSSTLALAGIDLALIGIFNESFGVVHLVVSVVFFFLVALTLFLFSYVSFPLGSPRIGALALLFGIVSAIVWFARFSWHGVAIQETITSSFAAIFVIIISIKTRRSDSKVQQHQTKAQ